MNKNEKREKVVLGIYGMYPYALSLILHIMELESFVSKSS